MTRSADIDFDFSRAVSVSEILHSLSIEGVSLHENNRISYVLDRDESFDWVQAHSSDINRIISAADESDPEGTTFVISISFSGTRVGGEILFHKGRRAVSFMASVNRRYISGTSVFCDFGWYLERLVPALEPFGLSEITARDYK
ncbi:hypothetical protein [Streptomyces sp. NPDC001816]|uniref:hypothetical protein n=1 Tax=Streptomyces sp. NPDC001816 TaxID=3364612 RepID=UPI0036A821C5